MYAVHNLLQACITSSESLFIPEEKALSFRIQLTVTQIRPGLATLSLAADVNCAISLREGEDQAVTNVIMS